MTRFRVEPKSEKNDSHKIKNKGGNRPLACLRPWDRVVICYLLIETVLIVLNTRNLNGWPLYVLVHAGLLTGVVLLARFGTNSPIRAVRIARDWYVVIYILAIFKMLGVLVPAISPTTYDQELLDWDHRIFGCQPGAFLDPIATPILTEVLRACWLSYFILPFLVGVPLYRRRDKSGFHEAVTVLVTGWLISFLGYYLVPAWGPGYYPDTIPAPDCVAGPGVTQTIALSLFKLEGRMNDVFPSGHAIIAVLVLWLAKRNRIKGWWLIIPLVLGLLVGTVYLRYHYGVDLIAGLLIAICVIRVATLFCRSRASPAPESC